MEKAADKAKELLHMNNKHSVDIEKDTAPAVVHEQVQETRHEHATKAHDREIHQHHHQTHVQPIQDRVVEPEQHHHRVLDTQHKEHHHGKDREVEAALREQASQFTDERQVLPTQQSKSVNTVVGEHVHHHIHDTIQPVVQREVVQPHVVHTTIPVHETIHKAPIVHSGNVLPTLTMEESQRQNISLTGGTTVKEHIDYQGEPIKIGSDSTVGFDHKGRHVGTGTTGAPGELGTAPGHRGAAGIVGGSGVTTAGPHNSNIANKMDPRVDSDLDGSRTVGGTHGTTGTGVTGTTGTTTGTKDTDVTVKPSTTDKILHTIGLK